MAPNLSGIAATDQARSLALCELAVAFALERLKSGGTLLMKGFQGAGFPALLAEMRREFDTVASRKPDASRDRSSEMYLLARRR
jgi:23S rRNA (uridine2552-2'-O)-methyltransferase